MRCALVQHSSRDPLNWDMVTKYFLFNEELTIFACFYGIELKNADSADREREPWHSNIAH